ncbi:hypothetical protein HPO96_37200 [Kribbella sandramycini]|uniref:Uncharacterized protein n=1 Tax=Kribbella sandramycini TaxID=60450 RepID=A0A7Y4L7T1_9ACTN|nr:hypothetical protein [Kribbella sandramycini]MBB6564441.1 hypothetical protein [Kribbella sandramycini]NOL45898.1 hypothetical protein [Kribbella sandramycini]
MIVAVHVGVALARPPREDVIVRVVVAAESDTEARLVACQLAAANRRVAMPVSAEIVSVISL